MTKRLYLENTYNFSSEGHIIKIEQDEKGVFLILDQTIFYPQSGGQPSDIGIIKNDHFETIVKHVSTINNEIRHYITSGYNEILIDSKIYSTIDQERRLLNARYHTAAHLLGNVVEIKAIKGHSFSGEAYVEFLSDIDIDKNKIQLSINEAIINNLKTKIFETDQDSFEKNFYKLPYDIPQNKNFRAMQIGDMFPVPCGGTHLSSTKEIGNLSISKIKLKNNILRISYILL